MCSQFERLLGSKTVQVVPSWSSYGTTLWFGLCLSILTMIIGLRSANVYFWKRFHRPCSSFFAKLTTAPQNQLCKVIQACFGWLCQIDNSRQNTSYLLFNKCFLSPTFNGCPSFPSASRGTLEIYFVATWIRQCFVCSFYFYLSHWAKCCLRYCSPFKELLKH